MRYPKLKGLVRKTGRELKAPYVHTNNNNELVL